MPIKTTCPSCGLSCTAPDHLHGKTIKCKRCATAFAIGSRAQLHDDADVPATSALQPRGLVPLPRAPWHRRLKAELLGGVIAITCAAVVLGIYLIVKAYLIK
jgi:uncharacterized paraquat-inducible protein A